MCYCASWLLLCFLVAADMSYCASMCYFRVHVLLHFLCMPRTGTRPGIYLLSTRPFFGVRWTCLIEQTRARGALIVQISAFG